MADLSAFHGEDQARCDVAHVDEIHDEIEIELKTLAEKTPDHCRRRCKVMVVRSDRHCWTADNNWKAGRGGLHRQSFGEQFRPCIGTRHVVRGQQGILDGIACGRGTKQNGLGRAMEKPRNTTLARSRNDNLSAAAIDGKKVVFTRHPHAR